MVEQVAFSRLSKNQEAKEFIINLKNPIPEIINFKKSKVNKKELINRLEDIEWEDFEVKEAKTEVPKSARGTQNAFSIRIIKLSETIGADFHKMINGWETYYNIKPGIS